MSRKRIKMESELVLISSIKRNKPIFQPLPTAYYKYSDQIVHFGSPGVDDIMFYQGEGIKLWPPDDLFMLTPQITASTKRTWLHVLEQGTCSNALVAKPTRMSVPESVRITRAPLPALELPSSGYEQQKCLPCSSLTTMQPRE